MSSYNLLLLYCVYNKALIAKLPFISVVDDDDSVRESLQAFIRSIGFLVETFPSAREFLKSEHLEKTNCVILDVRMPVMNGLELHRRLVASGRAIPAIFITAYGDKDSKAEAIKNGAVDYLLKPFREDALRHSIAKALLFTNPPQSIIELARTKIGSGNR